GAAACGPGPRDPVDGVGRGGRDPRGLRACGCRGARRRAALAGGGGGDVADGGKCRAPRPDRLRGEVSDVVERAGSTTVVGRDRRGAAPDGGAAPATRLPRVRRHRRGAPRPCPLRAGGTREAPGATAAAG